MAFPPTNPALERALTARGYAEPTPVQSAVLQPEAAGRDLLVSAQTGSGKTVAYGLAFAGLLLGEQTRFPAAGAPAALVVAPTRELAMQVHRELSWLYEHTGAHIVSCIGGMDARTEARALAAGSHIVVGTPGRLCDHLTRKRLDLSGLLVAVLDEADEMLDLGFREELDSLLAAAPADRRTLLFSATIAREIAALARQFQHDALRIDTLVRNQAHADIEYRAIRVGPRDTEHAVVNVLRFFEAPTALVFCATRDGVRHLHASLLERGFTSVALSGELTQNERTRALQALRDGQARVCVATDVAARGLDLPDLGLVIHADLPNDKAMLLHRSGRTGRAGRKGICMLVVPANRYRRAETLLSTAGVSASWGPAPTTEDIRALDSQRLLADPILTAPIDPEDLALARTLLEGRSGEEIAAALIRQHRARLPAPEELSSPNAAFERRPARDAAAPQQMRETAEPVQGSEPMAWFTMNIGRQNKADPKWLVPLICRLGGVKKRDIGAIKIADTETRFEIREAIALAFTAALPAEGADEVSVRPASGAPMPPRPEFTQPRRFRKPVAGGRKVRAHSG